MATITLDKCIGCSTFPCEDVDHSHYLIPSLEIDPARIKVVIISEAAPPDPGDHYYGGEEASFAITTFSVFQSAGFEFSSFSDLLENGIYCTTAVKCGKTGYGVKTATIIKCSLILEKELALFPNVNVYMLMGDVAINAVNQISKQVSGERAVPAGSTYRIRNGNYSFMGKPVIPSYLQVGPSFGIEKSKQRMIIEDIQKMKNYQ